MASGNQNIKGSCALFVIAANMINRAKVEGLAMGFGHNDHEFHWP